jgi:S1-C subfamily serine protease
MRKFTIHSLFLLFFCTFISFSQINGGEVDKKLHQDCLYPTVYVGRADGSGYGSGVIVRSEKVNESLYKNVFITCAHVTDETSIDYEIKYFTYENWSQVKEVKSFPATFVAYNRDMDIAIGVFFSNEVMPTAKLDFNPKLFIGNEVFRIGCGLGDDPRLDYGRLTAYKKTPKPTFRTSVMTVPGDSGSPLFHENKVIGIVVSIRSYRNLPVFTISYAVPLERFKTWNANNNNDLSFAWDFTKGLPEMQFRYLQFKEYEIK